MASYYTVPMLTALTFETQLLCVAAFSFFVVLFIRRRNNPIHSIPTIGPSGPVLSYLGAFKYYRDARAMLNEGYQKYPVFKIALPATWLVVVSGPKMNDELRKFPDDQMSFYNFFSELFQVKYTIGRETDAHPLQINLISGKLTRQLPSCLPSMVDELTIGYQELFPAKHNEWTSYSVYPLFVELIIRISNRAFVGYPLCREKELYDICETFMDGFMKTRALVNMTPKLLQPVVGNLLPWTRRTRKRMAKFMGPAVAERRKALKECGENSSNKPNDLLTWLVEEADEMELGDQCILECYLASNFGAIHTTSASITHAVYHLAASPEFVEPLREEVETALREDGWTKTAFLKMRKLDSFLKESQRFNGAGATAVLRKALKEVTFSDGSRIPPGTMVVAAVDCTHHDEAIYEEPHVFKPFRFSDSRGDEKENIGHQFVQTSPSFVAFGHGKHACPGRFFAVTELKLMMTYILLNYDIKMEGDLGRPQNKWIVTAIMPADDVKVMFRKRQDVSL